MRADYHIHPNLPRKHPEQRLTALWSAIEKHRLDAVVCAEHSFKDSAGAYRKMMAAKPKQMRCHVFPGAELVTSGPHGGVDVIAFAEEDWYDAHPHLLEPFSMTLTEMLRYLEASDLQYFMPHPLILGTSLRRLFRTQDEMIIFLATIPAFEARNGSPLLVDHLCTFLPVLHPILRNFREKLRTSAEPLLDLYFKEHTFLAVGSDAHHPRELGFSVEIHGKTGNRRIAFERLTHNTDLKTLYLPSFSNPFPRLLSFASTAFHEWWMRKRGRLETLREEEVLVAAGREAA